MSDASDEQIVVQGINCFDAFENVRIILWAHIFSLLLEEIDIYFFFIEGKYYFTYSYFPKFVNFQIIKL